MLVAFCFSACYAASSPLLVVLLMVKNEEDVIIPTLETYLPKEECNKAALDEIGYVLYDTGSTDRTRDLAREFFEKHGIKNYVIKEEPFVKDNFAASRNNGLAFTRSYFPDSTFILFPDAEWYLNSMDALLDFCRSEKAQYDAGTRWIPHYYALIIEIRRDERLYEISQQRLFLTADDVIFEGDIHECPNKVSMEKVPRSVYFELGASKSGQEKSRQRWYRDRDVLLKRLLAHPEDPRAAFHLGLTELWLGNLRNAYTYLKHRTTLHSFPEEDYLACYKLGIVTMLLAEEEPTIFTWNEAHSYFLKAYSIRPHRAEPLVRIAAHYMAEDNHPVSYIYSKRAVELPRPQEEMLEVEYYLYDYERWELFSRSAWYFGDYTRGEQATLNAIEACPNYPHLYRNLAFFWDQLPTTTQKEIVA